MCASVSPSVRWVEEITECAEELCRQVVTVSLSVSQPPGSTTPEPGFGDTQSTPGTPRGSGWRAHRPMAAMAQLLCALGPGGSGAHNEGHSHTRPACGTASQLPVQQPGRCSGCAGGRLLPGEYCFGLVVPLSPPSGARPCQGAVLASSGSSQGGQGTAPSCTQQVSSPGSAWLVQGSPPSPGRPGCGTRSGQ